MVRTLLTVVCVFAAAVASARAADDPTKDKLDKAKTAYDEQTEKSRAALIKRLQDREEAARKEGNKKLVDQVKAEREAFESRGELPKTVPTTGYVRESKQARIALEAAYAAAIKEYTKAKKDDEAAVVEKELAAFKEDGEAPAVPLAQLLVKDSVWEGRKWNAPGKEHPLGQEVSFLLKVTDRDDKRFKGHVVIKDGRPVSIEGTVEGDRVAFATEKKGKWQQNFEGRLRGRTLTLVFAGTGNGGEDVKGRAALAPAKGK